MGLHPMSTPLDQRPHEPDWYCPATSKQTGDRCGNKAGQGTDHLGHGLCSNHGGSSPGGRKQGKTLEAQAACESLGLRIDTTPAEALLDDIRETVANIAYYRARVQELNEVYGSTYHASGEPTGKAEPHVLVNLYNEERRHLTTVSSAALKAGVDLAVIEAIRQRGDFLVEFIRGVLERLGLQDDPRALEAVRAELVAVTSTPAAVIAA